MEGQTVAHLDLTRQESAAIVFRNTLARSFQGLWPGFDPGRIPLAVYTPGERVILVGHPTPPPEFETALAVTGPVHVHRGNHELIRAATDVLIGGVYTACIPAGHAESEGYPLASLMGLLGHEAFHAYQETWPDRGLDSRVLETYPEDDPANNAMYQIENSLLVSAFLALRSKAASTAPDSLAHFVNLRRYRLGLLAPEHAFCEDRFEKNEGTAQYIYFRILDGIKELYGKDHRLTAHAEGCWQQYLGATRRLGVGGFGKILLRCLIRGGIMCCIMDMLGLQWKEEVQQGQTPGQLLESAVAQWILRSNGFEAHLARETGVLREREEEKRRLRAEFGSECGLLIIHHGSAGESLRRVWDPMNLAVYPDGKRIHTRMFRLEGPGFVVDSHSVPPVPVLEDVEASTVSVPLVAAAGHGATGLNLSGPDGAVPQADHRDSWQGSLHIESDGLVVRCGKCLVRREGESVHVTLLGVTSRLTAADSPGSLPANHIPKGSM